MLILQVHSVQFNKYNMLSLTSVIIISKLTLKKCARLQFSVGDLKKALSESAEDFKRAYGGAEQPTKDAELIFSCRSGNRSRKAMATARELGFLKQVILV